MLPSQPARYYTKPVSDYAGQAITQHGAAQKALLLTLKRLLRLVQSMGEFRL